MPPETLRRLSVLGLVALASAGAAALGASVGSATTVTPPAMPRAPHVRLAARCPVPAKLRPAFEAAARDTKLPTSLLYAVAKIESNMKPDATSSAGAHGLLQLMPSTAAMLALDIDTPRTNVLAGARYLRQLLTEFGSNDLALAAYNAGPTAVAKAGGAPSGSVLSYVANVTEVWRSHAGCR
ncbi:MAG TPA: lytic transglycosylase domain-containing protein [Gaiellaceae bacterium]|nr:lytic transglycosylase domain-containing protein [Gaiellaceae bacterium]